jgi:hypothetical protein
VPWYDGLLAFRDAQPAEARRVTLDFARMEALAGEPLSRSAFTSGYWHAGRTAEIVRRLAAHGWAVAAFDRYAGAATFERTEP